jgi:hypothetical protein
MGRCVGKSYPNSTSRKHRRLIENARQLETMLQKLRDECDAVEECYEFMLAYAAQGLPADAGSSSGEKLRGLLASAVKAISSLPGTFEAAISQANLQPAEKHRAYLSVLKRDAGDALAAMELVLAQPAISSQLIDNLNASIHLRALLTDLFLIDEIAKLHQSSAGNTLSAQI